MATVDEIAKYCIQEIGPSRVDYSAQSRAELEQLFEQGYRALGVMERHLSDREFFVGDSPTIADVALYVYPHVCPEDGYDLEGFPAVRAWLTI
jgi:glutathione S-transferase